VPISYLEISYSAVNKWTVSNHFKKALRSFQKHLPKLHLTHKSLNLDMADRNLQFAASNTKTKIFNKNKKLTAD